MANLQRMKFQKDGSISGMQIEDAGNRLEFEEAKQAANLIVCGVSDGAVRSGG